MAYKVLKCFLAGSKGSNDYCSVSGSIIQDIDMRAASLIEGRWKVSRILSTDPTNVVVTRGVY